MKSINSIMTATCFAFGGIVMLFSAMAEEVENVHELNILVNGTFEDGSSYDNGSYA